MTKRYLVESTTDEPADVLADADPEFNQLGEQARTTLDVKRRYDAYQRMLDIFEKQAPGMVLYAPVENYAAQEDVSWSPYPFYYADFRAYNLSFAK